MLTVAAVNGFIESEKWLAGRSLAPLASGPLRLAT